MKARRSTTRSFGAFKAIVKAWELILFSLILDALLVLRGYAPLSIQDSQQIGMLCALITLPFINQRAVTRTLAQACRLQRTVARSYSYLAKVLLGLMIAMVIAIKLLLLPSLDSSVSIIFAIVLIVGVVTSIGHTVRTSRENSQALKEQPWLYIQLWERQLVATFFIPMIAARTISLLGALSNQSLAMTTTFFVSSLILLLVLRPHSSAFLGWCETCKAPTSIAFVNYGSCPRCDKNLSY